MEINIPFQTEMNYEDYTLLIVDDNATNLAVISDYLRQFGFQIMVARSGERALKRAKYAQPDLILLDVMMPGMDGFETCQRLKKIENIKDNPVIFMTALAGAEDKMKGFEVGGVDYVTKPFQQEEVLARVTTHLQIRGLTRKLQEQNVNLAETAEALQTANAELTQTNASKDKLFAIISHDLRTPFQALLGNAELLSLMAENLSTADVQEMGQSIHQSAIVAFNLLDNLLQWSQLQRGTMPYEPVEVDLNILVEQSVKLLNDKAAQKKITLFNEVEPGTTVYIDENMIDTVIRNLISNALKFTPVKGEVRVLANGVDPRLVEVVISDTGIGIAPQDIDKLFRIDVYHSTTGTAKEIGTGLGLIICQEMVGKNEGQIWIESELGQGTQVKFTVPLNENQSDD